MLGHNPCCVDIFATAAYGVRATYTTMVAQQHGCLITWHNLSKLQRSKVLGSKLLGGFRRRFAWIQAGKSASLGTTLSVFGAAPWRRVCLPNSSPFKRMLEKYDTSVSAVRMGGIIVRLDPHPVVLAPIRSPRPLRHKDVLCGELTLEVIY